jgi:butyryl-CoA dehydrogenase
MSKYVDLDVLRFLLFDVHEIEDLFSLDRYKDYDKESVDIAIQSVKDFADKEMYPYYQAMDREGIKYENGKVTAPEQLGKILKIVGENGWIGSHFDYEEGGSQMPHMMEAAMTHIREAANNGVTGYTGLTSGSANLIRNFGSKELFDRFIPNMLTGKWGGTMALTEPQAGSSLSDIKTSAYRREDGTFLIKGQKIFISGGDHQCADNFIHLTLARIEGAPAGTKGISLFVIPKYRDENGEFVYNDVFTAGEYDKMGQKAYVTTHLMFGENNDCRGFLVGEENRGLKYMFLMMNGARIAVGLSACSTATAAYHASLQYAKERPQGRKILPGGQKNHEEGQTFIINHPDVRRMLMLQKSIVEGALSLILSCAKYHDLELHADSQEEKTRYHDLLELLTPIAKTYPSEMGLISISNGMQVLGGYGYTKDFPLEQYFRDIRIMAIYEGTTGIQSLDLLGRKITLNNGRGLQFLIEEMQATISKAGKYDELKTYAEALNSKISLSQEVLQYLIGFAMKGEHERFISDATLFMEFTSNIVIAWHWLKMSVVAKEALVTQNMNFKSKFYEDQIHTMKFYFKYELPKTTGLAQSLMDPNVLTVSNEKIHPIFS